MSLQLATLTGVQPERVCAGLGRMWGQADVVSRRNCVCGCWLDKVAPQHAMLRRSQPGRCPRAAAVPPPACVQLTPGQAVTEDGLPAVRRLLNVYHPYDPVAHRQVREC